MKETKNVLGFQNWKMLKESEQEEQEINSREELLTYLNSHSIMELINNVLREFNSIKNENKEFDWVTLSSIMGKNQMKLILNNKNVLTKYERDALNTAYELYIELRTKYANRDGDDR